MKHLRPPKHWEDNGIVSRILSPFSIFYSRATAAKVAKKGYRSKAKVICVGNVVAGGAGKTPTAIAIAKLLQGEGRNVHFISKGYGRKSENIGVVRVKTQSSEEVGDEPLLLAQTAPTWVGDDRAEMAKRAEEQGAEVLIMDDGFQSPDLDKDFSIIVVDGGYGFGNSRVIPAGPLREPVEAAFKRADMLLVIGKQAKDLPKTTLPVFKANIEIEVPETVREEEVLAFCGIGRPDKFFESLKNNGIKLVEELAFPDHHFYNEADFKAIFGIANKKSAVIVTTAKDMVKIPDRFRKIIYPVKAHIEFSEKDKFMQLLLGKIGK